MNDKDLWIAPTRLIAAWGDTEGYHGLNRARRSTRLFSESSTQDDVQLLESSLLKVSDGFFHVRENNHEIKTIETEYHSICRTFSDIKQEIGSEQDSLTLLGIIPMIDEDTAQFVHHFIVTLLDDCSGNNAFSRSMLYGWAPGADGFSLPPDVGFPLPDGGGRSAIELEIHYNNPGLIPGKIDSSGVRFFYSYQETAQMAGMLQLADPIVALGGESISDGLSKYEFSCPGSCSSLFLDSEVTVIAECK